MDFTDFAGAYLDESIANPAEENKDLENEGKSVVNPMGTMTCFSEVTPFTERNQRKLDQAVGLKEPIKQKI